MALKAKAGRMVAVEDGKQKGIRLRTPLLDNTIVIWEGDESTIALYAQKLTSAGYRVVTKKGFGDLYNLEVDVSSVLRKAFGPIGALPTQPSQTFTAG